MCDAGPQSQWRAAQPAEDVGEVSLQFGDAIRAGVGERPLRQVPHAFVGVEFGSIGREPLQAKPWEPAAEVSKGVPFVDPAVVPQDDDVASQVAQEVPEELARLSMPNVLLRVELEVQPEAAPPWTHRHSGDDRNLVAAVEMAMDRGLAARRPRSVHAGYEQEARLVYEDEMGAQPLGVFFTRGQSFFLQHAMASSSRSTARRSGFWWLQFIRCINRAMWLRWKRTSKRFSTTSAIRCVVQRSVRYPLAIAPRSKIRTSRRSWVAVNCLGRPGDTRTRRASSPRRRHAFRQRITELAAQPIRRATSLNDKASDNSFRARRRRSERKSAEPFKRIMDPLPRVHYCII